jgi:hypothetical protein
MIEDALKPDKSGLEKLFESIEARTEILAKPMGIEAEWLAREDRWKQKRIGKITASKLPNLMKSGRAKGEEWGQTAITTMFEVAHERRTGIERPSLKGVKALEWGKQYEPEALEFYKNKTGIDMRSGSFDFDDIVFVEPFENFGDSPDGITLDGIGRAEIKCPESGAIHYDYCTITAISEKDDYYWQFLGHLLDDQAEWCDFVSYDPRSKEDDPLKMHIVRVVKMDHKFNLARLRARIEKANQVIDLALEKNDISIIKNVNNL